MAEAFLMSLLQPAPPEWLSAASCRSGGQHVQHRGLTRNFCSRVLHKGGTLVSITFDQPHFRKPFLEAAGLIWQVQLQTFGDGLQYFVYTMIKGSHGEVQRPLHIQPAPVSTLAASMEHEHMDQEDYLLQMEL